VRCNKITYFCDAHPVTRSPPQEALAWVLMFFHLMNVIFICYILLAIFPLFSYCLPFLSYILFATLTVITS
jgi:hypothetical protein